MSGPVDTPVLPSSRDFSVFSQKLELDLDFPTKSLIGKTELVILPLSKELRTIRLNCRQCTITRLTVEGKPATWKYQDPYQRLRAHSSFGVHQHHLFRVKIESQLNDPPEEELVFNLPRGIRVQEISPFSAAVKDTHSTNSIQGVGDTSASLVTPGASTAVEPSAAFASLKIRIEFENHNVRDGLHFVGLDGGDRRYPHVYTRNSPYPGTASCLFPCVDDPRSRCSWEVSIRCPRTLGDVFERRSSPASNAQDSGEPGYDKPKASLRNGNVIAVSPDNVELQDSTGLDDEEKLLEMSVVCSGEMTDEIVDPQDPSRKTVSFSCASGVSPNQVGFAVGPFEDIDLSGYREIDDDEKLGANSIRVHGFCLPGRADEVQNTCLPLAKALDFFTTTFTTYPFDSYVMCFVDDLTTDTVVTAGLSLCSTRLLFPQDIIDPLEPVTRQMIHALSTQYAGISIIAKEPSDSWAVIGMANFMTELFLKHLSGNNEYRYRQKKAADRVHDLDFQRPSLHAFGAILHLDPSEYEFMALKAGLVLYILDRRLTKSGGSAGMTRIVSRVTGNAKGGESEFSALSTAQFQKTCEKIGHMKLDAFFQQWVFGAGCPNFTVSQRFNKKKFVIEMMIKQTQGERAATPHDLDPDMFMRDVKEDLHEVYEGQLQPVFTGPMTIRIHEADGTPYEHIVEIKEAITKFEIPYNTKYKRLKRSRRQKERAAGTGVMDVSADLQDDVLLYCLGDVLQSEEEVADWQLTDWSKDEEDRMGQESYEWIRMDADFEWICKMTIGMPAYMFVSQLQQDRDVVAQMESLQYIAMQKGHPLVSTILTRTLVDRRYFHGVRTMAAVGLTKCAKDELDWIGLYHLEKTFQEFFCFSDSPMTRSNDFSDRTSYLVQCAIPRAISKIRNNAGQAPMRVKRFFVDKLKFNDNSNNEFSDSHYVAMLMSCLADTLTAPNEQRYRNDFEDDDDEEIFVKDAINEIERYRRIDEWIASYHNVFSVTALDCLLRLCKSKTIQAKLADFLQYTRTGNSDMLRLKAFTCLTDLGTLKIDAVLNYFLHNISMDPSPYIRNEIYRRLGKGLALIAMGEHQPQSQGQIVGDLIIEQEGLATEVRQADIARRQTIPGALAALKVELGGREALKQALWAAVTSPYISIHEISDLLELCSFLYEPETSLVITFKYPRYYRVQHVGHGVLKFSLTDRYRTKPLPPLHIPPPTPAVTAPPSTKTPKASPIVSRVPDTMGINGHAQVNGFVYTNGNTPVLTKAPTPKPARQILKLKTNGLPKTTTITPTPVTIKQESPIKHEPEEPQPITTNGNGNGNGNGNVNVNGNVNGSKFHNGILSLKINAKINGNTTNASHNHPPPSSAKAHSSAPPPPSATATMSPPPRRASTASDATSVSAGRGRKRKSATPQPSPAKKRKSATPQPLVAAVMPVPVPVPVVKTKPLLKIRLSTGGGAGSVGGSPAT